MPTPGASAPAPFADKPGIFCQVTVRAACRHSRLYGVVSEGISSAGKREREKTKVVPGFPEREVLCRKVKVVISPGSEFPGCFRASSAGAMPYAGSNPAQQAALTGSGADKMLRLLAVCGRAPAEHGQGHPVCWGQSEVPGCRLWVLLLRRAPGAGLCLFCLRREKVRTDPKRAFFYNGSNQALIKLVREAVFHFTVGNVLLSSCRKQASSLRSLPFRIIIPGMGHG